MTDEQLTTEFQEVEDAFNEAVISNKVDEISKCISNDWVLIEAQGGIIQDKVFSTLLNKDYYRIQPYNNVERNFTS